jgi:hypothetical protein
VEDACGVCAQWRGGGGVAVARVVLERPSCSRVSATGVFQAPQLPPENVGPWEHARGGGGLRMQDVMEWDMVEVIAQAGRGV